MAWVKIPAEHHPIFRAALPKDPRVTTLNMFGGIAAMVNGNMFGGLFGRSMIAKLAPADQQAALALDGSEPFDPMGNGRLMKDIIFLSESVMDEPEAMRDWLRRALAYSATLPVKVKKPRPAQPAGQRAAAKPARSAKPSSASRAKPATAKPAPARRATPAPAKRTTKSAPAKRTAAKRATKSAAAKRADAKRVTKSAPANRAAAKRVTKSAAAKRVTKPAPANRAR